MKNKIKHIIKSVAFVFLIGLGSVFSTQAQINMTKIQDASVSASNTTPHEGAVLELESNNKGMLVPRMTTGQRDAIAESKRTESLFIFNTTTGCFNYWSSAQSTWLSLCGTPPPAVFNITETQCNSIVVNGTFKQGEALKASNFLSLTVTVIQPGTYDVMALTTNGYYFTANGTFPNAGIYTIQLEGTGIPNLGYDPPASSSVGDLLQIKVNGVESDCEHRVFVEKANVSYSIDCGSITQEGDYFIGIGMNVNNKLTMSVNVTSTGYWNIHTNTVNGLSFSGTGTFTSLGTNMIELTATGAPIASGLYSFTVYSNSDPASSCSGVQISISNVAYTIKCNQATVNGAYMEVVPTTAVNTISLPISVTATGNSTITTNTVNGISFTSGPITLSSIGEQTITLFASGTPLVGTNTNFNIIGTPGASAICEVAVPISPQPVSYTMVCSSTSLSGNYAPGIAMGASNTITLNVNAVYGGTWNITTDVKNGISFSGSGTLTVGANTLVLNASGMPLTGGTFNYTLTSNSATNATTCSKSVLFIYREMNILGLGTGAYQPGTASTSEASRAIPSSTSSFSATGTFPVKKITIFNAGSGNASSIKNSINSNKIDIIVIGYNFTPNNDQRAVLVDFVKNKKGVLIHSQENDLSGTQELIQSITGGNPIISGSGPTYYNPTTNANDLVLNGPFGDFRNKGFGADVNNGYYVTGLPSTVTILATNNQDSSRAHAFKDNRFGYLYIGDSGWLAGSPTNGSNTIWPSRITSTGLPSSKPYTGGTVYNSFIYANSIAWAIKYAQENTLSTYILP